VEKRAVCGNSLPRQKVAGFTLLEVMIALVVVATVLTVLIGLGTRSVSTHERLQKTTQGILLAQTKLTELETELQGTGVGFSNEKGRFDPPFELFTWETVFSSTPVEGVKQVDITVAWGDTKRNEAVQLASFLFE